MRVAIVGCGRVGTKRAQALVDSRLVVVADADPQRARELASAHPGCTPTADWKGVVDRDDVDLVIVATTHDALARIALGAVQHGKHVLVEKPAARSPAELKPLLDAARVARVTVKVGFNHRFHPALRKAREIFDSGGVGPLMLIRGRYGHGGRPGYEREWRAQPERSGGGELLDQGVHMIDLARWFAGDFAEVRGFVETLFWGMPVEDNAFVFLRAPGGPVAWLHASWTEWKNLFSFEVFGRTGKIEVYGLGGSYGTERLTFYRMRPGIGPPDMTAWEYPAGDTSWREEYAHLLTCIREGGAPSGSLEDALAALEVIQAVYAQSGRHGSRPAAGQEDA